MLLRMSQRGRSCGLKTGLRTGRCDVKTEHDGSHVDCLPCEITKIAKPHWWHSYHFDWRDGVIAFQAFILLVMFLCY